MTTHQFQIQGLTKKFKQGASSIQVLSGVDITFKQHGSYAITGISGSGKSTFMHIVAGLDNPDKGTVLFDERDIHAFTPQERECFLNQSIGLVFQLPYLIRELSVIENVMLKGRIIGEEKDVADIQALELLRRVGLADKAHEKPTSLSGGQQQRVAILRALFNKPAFLIADEPTGSLDSHTGQSIIDFLLECQQLWGMGLIISSHDPYVAQKMEEVWQLSDGKLNKI